MIDNLNSITSLPVERASLFYSDPRVHARDSGQKRLSLLFMAIDRESVHEVRHLLNTRCSKKIPINSIRKGISPLHFAAACEHGNIPIIDLLLRAGADSNNRDCYGNTPLHYARDQKVKTKLIRAKGNPALKNQRGEDAIGFKRQEMPGEGTLLNAILKGKKDEAISLIDKSPSQRDGFGRSALHYAASCGEVEILKYLLSTDKLKIDDRDKDGETPLFTALQMQKKPIARLLVSRGADVNAKDKKGWTPLHEAARGSSVSLVELLISHGALECFNKAGMTPYMLAKEEENEKIAQVIFDQLNKPRSDIQVRKFQSPLHLAVLSFNIVEVQKHLVPSLLEACDIEEKTPLHYAIFYGFEQAAKLLLEKGANLEARDKNQETSLWITLRQETPSLRKLLLRNRADTSAINLAGQTPLTFCIEEGNMAGALDLLEAGADVNLQSSHHKTSLHSAVRKDYKHLASLLLKHGAKVDETNILGLTPLHMALQLEHNQLALMLMEQGANLEACDSHNSTPLHYAAANGDSKILKSLISLLNVKNDSLNPLNFHENTPLHIYCMNWEGGDISGLKMLCDCGADPKIKNRSGLTPLDIARKEGKQELVTFFEQNKGYVNIYDYLKETNE